MRFAGNDVVYTGQWLDSKRHGQGKLVFDKAEKCFYEGVPASANNCPCTYVSMTVSSCKLIRFKIIAFTLHTSKLHSVCIHVPENLLQAAVSPSLSCLNMSTSQAQVRQCMRRNTKTSSLPKTDNTIRRINGAGGWKDNLKHGQGIMRYSSGNTYSGEWEGDLKQGQGCMQWGEGEVYTGQWAAGLQNGLGQHVWIQPASSGATQGSNHAFFLMHNR